MPNPTRSASSWDWTNLERLADSANDFCDGRECVDDHIVALISSDHERIASRSGRLGLGEPGENSLPGAESEHVGRAILLAITDVRHLELLSELLAQSLAVRLQA